MLFYLGPLLDGIKLSWVPHLSLQNEDVSLSSGGEKQEGEGATWL